MNDINLDKFLFSVKCIVIISIVLIILTSSFFSAKVYAQDLYGVVADGTDAGKLIKFDLQYTHPVISVVGDTGINNFNSLAFDYTKQKFIATYRFRRHLELL